MVAIETRGQTQKGLVRDVFSVTQRDTHDTFSRVLSLIDPQQLHKCFLAWVNNLSKNLDINVISIDGKTARGSYDREKGFKALHTVTAWASEHHLVLAQQWTKNRMKLQPFLAGVNRYNRSDRNYRCYGKPKENCSSNHRS